jgi:hypothetical protein
MDNLRLNLNIRLFNPIKRDIMIHSRMFIKLFMDLNLFMKVLVMLKNI